MSENTAGDRTNISQKPIVFDEVCTYLVAHALLTMKCAAIVYIPIFVDSEKLMSHHHFQYCMMQKLASVDGLTFIIFHKSQTRRVDDGDFCQLCMYITPS